MAALQHQYDVRMIDFGRVATAVSGDQRFQVLRLEGFIRHGGFLYAEYRLAMRRALGGNRRLVTGGEARRADGRRVKRGIRHLDFLTVAATDGEGFHRKRRRAESR